MPRTVFNKLGCLACECSGDARAIVKTTILAQVLVGFRRFHRQECYTIVVKATNLEATPRDCPKATDSGAAPADPPWVHEDMPLANSPVVQRAVAKDCFGVELWLSRISLSTCATTTCTLGKVSPKIASNLGRWRSRISLILSRCDADKSRLSQGTGPIGWGKWDDGEGRITSQWAKAPPVTVPAANVANSSSAVIRRIILGDGSLGDILLSQDLQDV